MIHKQDHNGFHSPVQRRKTLCPRHRGIYDPTTHTTTTNHLPCVCSRARKNAEINYRLTRDISKRLPVIISLEKKSPPRDRKFIIGAHTHAHIII